MSIVSCRTLRPISREPIVSIALAQISASRFVQEFDPRDGKGLLLVGGIGTGKTHLAVGILKDSLLPEGAPAFFATTENC